MCKSLAITNKFIKEIDSREVIPLVDFRFAMLDEHIRKYLLEELRVENNEATVDYRDIKDVLFFDFSEKKDNTSSNFEKLKPMATNIRSIPL